jgi:hypothetical protein
MLYGHCFSTLLQNLPLGRSTEIISNLKLNGTHQLLACVDDVNLLSKNIKCLNKNTYALLETNKEVHLEVNAEKTKCVFTSPDQNV